MRSVIHFHAQPQRTRGFTLIELLVAIAILGIMVVLLASLTGLSSRTLTDQTSRSENFTKARSTLDLLASDIVHGVFREDLGAFTNAAGQPSLSFYTRRLGVGGDRSLSLLSYRVDGDATLTRAAKVIPWNDTKGLGFGTTDALPRTGDITGADYDEVLTGVVRLEHYFLNQDGSLSNNYTTNAKSICVAIAVVDEQTLRVIKDNGKIDALINKLPAQNTLEKSYTQFWNQRMAASGFYDGQPAQVRNGLRVFERYILLPK